MFLAGWLAHRSVPRGNLVEAFRGLVKRSKDNRLVLVMNLLALWMVFTSFFALHKGTALGSSLMTIAVAWLCFTVIVPYILQDENVHTALLAAFVSSATVAAAVAVAGYYHSGAHPYSRASVWIMGPNSLGNMMATSLLASALLMVRVRPRLRVFIGAAALLQFVTLVFTRSRGSWLAMAAAVAVLLLCTRSKAAIAITTAVVLVFAVWIALDPVLLRRVESITSLEANLDRLDLFRAGILMMRDRPITGFGVNNARQAYQAYTQSPSTSLPPFLHNIFVEFGATTGIPGLLLVVALIGGLLYVGAKSTVLTKAPLAICTVYAMLVAQIVHLQVDIIIFAATTMPLVFIPTGILLRYRDRAH